ncbi:MAG: hypothetical protein IKY74_00640 [Alistipes sp.]|nr:hypothetical protein [Alistipes sp.]
MRTLKNLLWAMLPLFCLSLAVSCTETPNTGDDPNQGGTNGPAVVKDTVIKMKKDLFEVGVAGGSQLAEYTIEALDGGENPHSGEKISAVAAESWVNGFNYNTSNILRFNVDPNPGSTPRECVVTVKYRYAEDVAFVVKQNSKSSAGFTFENVTSTLFDYTLDIIPEDKNTPFIVMSASCDYIVASGFQTTEDFYEDDIAYFDWLGSFYGQDYAGIMQEKARFGDQRKVTVTGCNAGTPYVFYCYYFDYETGALASDVYTHEIWTLFPEKQEVEFTMEYTVDGSVVAANVAPIGFDGDYYFDVLSVAHVNSYLNDLVRLDGTPYFTTPDEAIEFWWSSAVGEMKQSMSTDQIIAAYTSKGFYEDGTPMSEFDFELLANTEYYLFAFAMDSNALACSTPQFVKVTTGDVEMSDNVITPSVSNITSRGATISFETTNDDYYVAGWATANEWATYGNNDAERQQYLLTNLSYEFISGNYTQTITQLTPATEYVLYAFGSRGGIATTPTIYTCRFTTRNGSGGACSITMADLGYYDAADVSAFDGYSYLSGYEIILPLEAQFSIPEHGAYFFEVYNWTNREYEVYDDENYIKGLTYMINKHGSMTVTHTYTGLENGGYYELVAIVIDNDGVYSDLYKTSYRPTYDGCRDAQAYVDWWNNYQNGGSDGPTLQSCVVEQKNLFVKKDARKRVSEMTFEPSKMDIE